MQKPYPNWLSDNQLHQASLLISELGFCYSGFVDGDELDQKIDSILDWEFFTVYQDIGLVYGVCNQAQYHFEFQDNCTINDVYTLIDRAKKLIVENKYIPDHDGIQLELFPMIN
ncbi:hypothetical protein [Planktothrix agardhii]|uniref:hypothetical protein n=1 Tax=Planktothrix agardhii TaxID=1160 RepID=UPI001D0B1346|nr:hypothetical protein [Planktothrix agardhii]MCB8762196.1 hypothetical protein [Planktothrix agardhii 1813]